MNSRLEKHKVRLRGLSIWVGAGRLRAFPGAVL